jgi:ADP-ribose pyrophosphatase YjhB (NUDIX family)
MEIAENIIIFIGVSPIKGSFTDPLDFATRANFFNKAICTVLPLMDHPDDEVWVCNLEKAINEVDTFGPVILVTGRDGFQQTYNKYSTKYHIEQIPEIANAIPGTALRNEVMRLPLWDTSINCANFKRGVIYGVGNIFQAGVPTADLAIINFKEGRILLGRKNNIDPVERYRCFGGYFDVEKDHSLEYTALREGHEEVRDIEFSTPIYSCSHKIDNWRYRRDTKHKIITTLFYAEYTFGAAKPGDDIDELQWFSLDDELYHIIIDEHRPLMKALLENERIKTAMHT